jgi:hypothetical protein
MDPKVEALRELLTAMIALNKLIAEPGQKAHCVWDTNAFLKKEIKKCIEAIFPS